MTAFYYLFY